MDLGLRFRVLRLGLEGLGLLEGLGFSPKP